MAHIEKRAENPDVLKIPTVKVLNSNNSDNVAPTKEPTVERLIHEDTEYKNFEIEPSKDSKILLPQLQIQKVLKI